jgi:hypothetical protein
LRFSKRVGICHNSVRTLGTVCKAVISYWLSSVIYLDIYSGAYLVQSIWSVPTHWRKLPIRRMGGTLSGNIGCHTTTKPSHKLVRKSRSSSHHHHRYWQYHLPPPLQSSPPPARPPPPIVFYLPKTNTWCKKNKNNELEISGNDDIVQRKEFDDGDYRRWWWLEANLYECCESAVEVVVATEVTTQVPPCWWIAWMGAPMANFHPFRVSVHGVEQIYTTRCWNPAW